jgi:hypothetical protein
VKGSAQAARWSCALCSARAAVAVLWSGAPGLGDFPDQGVELAEGIERQVIASDLVQVGVLCSHAAVVVAGYRA